MTFSKRSSMLHAAGLPHGTASSRSRRRWSPAAVLRDAVHRALRAVRHDPLCTSSRASPARLLGPYRYDRPEWYAGGRRVTATTDVVAGDVLGHARRRACSSSTDVGHADARGGGRRHEHLPGSGARPAHRRRTRHPARQGASQVDVMLNDAEDTTPYLRLVLDGDGGRDRGAAPWSRSKRYPMPESYTYHYPNRSVVRPAARQQAARGLHWQGRSLRHGYIYGYKAMAAADHPQRGCAAGHSPAGSRRRATARSTSSNYKIFQFNPPALTMSAYDDATSRTPSWRPTGATSPTPAWVWRPPVWSCSSTAPRRSPGRTTATADEKWRDLGVQVDLFDLLKVISGGDSSELGCTRTLRPTRTPGSWRVRSSRAR